MHETTSRLRQLRRYAPGPQGGALHPAHLRGRQADGRALGEEVPLEEVRQVLGVRGARSAPLYF
jgi:hypothetical protein